MYVELKHINKTFGDYKASNDVSFGIEKGKLIGLLGPSGSGKTTILRMIAGLEQPDDGDIFIDGKRINDVAASKRGIGFVFQNYALFRYMTVFDNIAFGLKVQKKPKGQIVQRVNEMIELIGLKGLEKRYPSQLSGGQRQRVAFARALAPNPQLLLLDEPFAAIDAKVRKELRSWLKEMIGQVGVTSIFVTHDQEEAIEVADEIIITRKGNVEQVGTPIEIYKNPSTPFVAEFIGESTTFEKAKRLKGFEGLGNTEKAVIRPEFITIRKIGSLKQYQSAAEEGIIEDISFRGSYQEIAVKVKDVSLVASRSLEEPSITVGEKVHVLIHRLYAFEKGKAFLVENAAMEDKNFVFI